MYQESFGMHTKHARTIIIIVRACFVCMPNSSYYSYVCLCHVLQSGIYLSTSGKRDLVTKMYDNKHLDLA